MCGIAGFADSTFGGRTGQGSQRLDAEFNLVHRMCEVIRHRGPDDEGIHVEPGVGLGMRRLSIIDLAGGHQPIHNEDSTVWVVFNGEIYNYRELRARARSARATRSTRPATPRRSSTPTSSGARTRSAGCAACSASRCGTSRSGRCCSRATAPASSRCTTPSAAAACTSAARSSRCWPPAPVDPRARTSTRSITTWRFSTRRATRRSSRACSKLPPGHFLRWRDGRRRGRAVLGDRRRRRPSADPKPRPSRRSSGVLPGRRAARTWSATCRSARSSPAASIPRAVVGMMARASSRPVKTFSIGFDEPAFDELEHARTRRAALRHRPPRVRRRPDGLSILDDMIGALRRAVRGLLGHPDVVRLGARAAARHGGALRRRRRRAVRRLRSLPAASARRARSTAAACPGCATAASLAWPLLPHGARGKNFLRHVGRDDRRPLPRLDRDLPARRAARRSIRPDVRRPRCAAATPRRRWRAFRALRRAAARQPDDAVRLRDLPAGRRADQGRSHEHGALDRVARAAARQPGHRFRRHRCRRH